MILPSYSWPRRGRRVRRTSRPCPGHPQSRSPHLRAPPTTSSPQEVSTPSRIVSECRIGWPRIAGSNAGVGTGGRTTRGLRWSRPCRSPCDLGTGSAAAPCFASVSPAFLPVDHMPRVSFGWQRGRLTRRTCVPDSGESVKRTPQKFQKSCFFTASVARPRSIGPRSDDFSH